MSASLPPPLLLLEPSLGCSHAFRDSRVCLRCGRHCSDIHLEQLGEPGCPISLELARAALRFVKRFGEPREPAMLERLEQLRAFAGGFDRGG